MIATIDYKNHITSRVDGLVYAQTHFTATDTTDITAMNASGSTYLNYPSGSSVFCEANKKVYMLNAARTAYVEV